MIIDMHAHIFDRAAGISGGKPFVSDRYGRMRNGDELLPFLPPSFEASASPYPLLAEYMDYAGIERALLLPNTLYGYFNAYAREAADAYPERFLPVALADAAGGEASARSLEALYASGRFFGLKVEMCTAFACKPGASLDDLSMTPIWELLNASGQPLFTHLATWGDFLALKKRMEDFPKVPVVLCHMGASAILGTDAGADERWDALTALLARKEELYLDTSCAFLYLEEEYPFPRANAKIEQIVGRFGARRVFWGSDYPGALHYATMRQLVAQIQNHLALPEADREAILGGSALEFLRRHAKLNRRKPL